MLTDVIWALLPIIMTALLIAGCLFLLGVVLAVPVLATLWVFLLFVRAIFDSGKIDD